MGEGALVSTYYACTCQQVHIIKRKHARANTCTCTHAHMQTPAHRGTHGRTRTHTHVFIKPLAHVVQAK